MTTKSKGTHEYRAHLKWEGNHGDGTSGYGVYGRGFRIGIEGKADLVGSADPVFRGDASKHNPEDLLLVALSSCHMLSYLALCARKGITVVEYTDEAEGVMTITPEGGGRFTAVTLHPKVSILGQDKGALALELHEQAHRECFIANSCNFPVTHHAIITCQ